MTDPNATDQRITFTGEPDSELETLLGDNFVSWLPSKRELAIKFDDGFELTVVEGDRVERQASGALIVWH
jgi:hypothetical protein